MYLLARIATDMGHARAGGLGRSGEGVQYIIYTDDSSRLWDAVWFHMRLKTRLCAVHVRPDLSKKSAPSYAAILVVLGIFRSFLSNLLRKRYWR
ncbi:hypothetical protein P152DRAFT_226393 [Eremomyces bilateralis CBS 781.70]|uniref:Uncharacterized protein n=1 Tax=Eremomyces bilateralis CBS 781.70 TaxID=1392243 RepID=A0A6G1FRM0_9PEZI|nr:uncharacterized protein P152DRAFT_226393 [Eremomyces bilateralis CBS 781.70]KAF1808312.1 hypothetical protein P152DRAFT_226393 [Eremomyces bilateralis CBS 781.70]